MRHSYCKGFFDGAVAAVRGLATPSPPGSQNEKNKVESFIWKELVNRFEMKNETKFKKKFKKQRRDGFAIRRKIKGVKAWKINKTLNLSTPIKKIDCKALSLLIAQPRGENVECTDFNSNYHLDVLPYLSEIGDQPNFDSVASRDLVHSKIRRSKNWNELPLSTSLQDIADIKDYKYDEID